MFSSACFFDRHELFLQMRSFYALHVSNARERQQGRSVKDGMPDRCSSNTRLQRCHVPCCRLPVSSMRCGHRRKCSIWPTLPLLRHSSNSSNVSKNNNNSNNRHVFSV